MTTEASNAVKHKAHKKAPQGSHHKKHKAAFSPPAVLLGGTKSGDVVSGGCNNLCSAAVGSSCVAISGGSITTPQCTCSAIQDCPCYSTYYYTNGTLNPGFGVPISCRQYTPTAPSNFKGNICCYGNAAGPGANKCQTQPYNNMGNGSPEQCAYGPSGLSG